MVVGLGPGDRECMTPQAVQAVKECDAVTGYETYLELISDLTGDKEIVSSGMRKEVDRARQALEIAEQDKTVAVVSSGDPGVYGMAGIILEVVSGKVPVEIVPGVTAASAAAASIGAPIVNDFASISLSDILTPWKQMVERIEAAALGNFVIVLYNPRSKGRPDNIKTAREVILWHRTPDTPVGIVRKANRGEEEKTITTLQDMLKSEIDMLTTVIIGNSETTVKNGCIVTPRGYIF
ncbi:MAG: precorrin-3B C(17)-methyltransferase [Clostridiales bacterium]|nr:precorrin-3B C(17)-methyltransferase [Clostridiales bacterium]MCF8022739.1 precorrin-3B C(17)-methyltransferase [Clostridiales bacterium]